jgi:hypothetical protein
MPDWTGFIFAALVIGTMIRCAGRGDLTPFIRALGKFRPLAGHVFILALRFRITRELGAFGALLSLNTIVFGSRRHDKHPGIRSLNERSGRWFRSDSMLVVVSL